LVKFQKYVPKWWWKMVIYHGRKWNISSNESKIQFWQNLESDQMPTGYGLFQSRVFLGGNPQDQIMWILCKLGVFSHQNGPNLKWKIQTIISGHSITNANFMPPCSVEIPQNYEQNVHQIRIFSQKTAPIKWHVTYLSLVFFVNQFHFLGDSLTKPPFGISKRHWVAPIGPE